MNLDKIVQTIAPVFNGCPRPVLESAVQQIYKEMESQRIEYPEDFPEAIEYGAKWKLYGQKSARWYDTNESSRHRALYLSARHTAKIREDQESDDYVSYSTVPKF